MKLFNLTKLFEMYQRLSRREKIIFYVSAMIVLVMVADRLVIGPIYHSMRNLDRQIRDMDANIKSSARLLNQKNQMTKEAEFYASYAVPTKTAGEGALVLLKQIQELASQASVNLLYVKPGGGGESPEENIYRVNFECEGQMDQLIGFFYAIENSKLLLRIEKYSLVPAAKGSSVVKCSATVVMGGIA